MPRVYSYSVVLRVVKVLRPRVYSYSVVVLRRPMLFVQLISCLALGFFPLVQLNQVVLEGSVYSSIAAQLSLAVFFRDASCNPVVIYIFHFHINWLVRLRLRDRDAV